MSYTNSQKKALCSDWLCLILCVFALCMAIHTFYVNVETESQYAALNESPVETLNSAEKNVTSGLFLTSAAKSVDALTEYGSPIFDSELKKA